MGRKEVNDIVERIMIQKEHYDNLVREFKTIMEEETKQPDFADTTANAVLTRLKLTELVTLADFERVINEITAFDEPYDLYILVKAVKAKNSGLFYKAVHDAAIEPYWKRIVEKLIPFDIRRG